MRLVIFGPQGAGKGTQGVRVSDKFGVPAISTGDIFRWAIKAGSELGDQVEQYVDSGQLVPDDLTIEVVSQRLGQDDCKMGFLLDGFPRNIGQAGALDGFLAGHDTQLDGAIILEVPEDISLRRLLGRRSCSNCGRNYHVDQPPAVNWTCDTCGGGVVERVDDHDEATIRSRLAIYHEQTEPLKIYYEKRGLLRSIDGLGPPDEVFDRLVAAL